MRLRPSTAAGLLTLRVGTALAVAWVLLIRQAVEPDALLRLPTGIAAVPLLVLAGGCVLAGVFTRSAASIAAVLCAAAAIVGLRAGEAWVTLPVRDAELALLFVALAFTGPGPLSLERKS